MNVSRLVALALLLAAGPARAEAERYLAVLDLSGDADRFLREALADRARTIASEALRGRWFVTTRENVLERLRRTGKSCSELADGCTVELGRAVGAELVLSGTARGGAGRPLELELTLHETKTGDVVASSTSTAESGQAALERMDEAVRALLALWIPLRGELDLYDPGFYVEGRLGSSFATMPTSGPLSCPPDGCAFPGAAGALLGYRLAERWAVEAQFAYVSFSDWRQGVDGAARFYAAGGEWTPTRLHGFALAGAVGAVRFERTLRDGGDPALPATSEAATAPAAQLELRLNATWRLVQLGLRVGARAAYRSTELRSPQGSQRLGPGWEFHVPLSVSLRVLL